MVRKNLSRLVLGLVGVFILGACSFSDSVGVEDASAQGKNTSNIGALTITYSYWGYSNNYGKHLVYRTASSSGGSIGYVERGEWFRIDGFEKDFYRVTYNSLSGLKTGYVRTSNVSASPKDYAWARPTSTLNVRNGASGTADIIGKVFAYDIVCVIEFSSPYPAWAYIQYQTSNGVKSGYIPNSLSAAL